MVGQTKVSGVQYYCMYIKIIHLRYKCVFPKFSLSTISRVLGANIVGPDDGPDDDGGTIVGCLCFKASLAFCTTSYGDDDDGPIIIGCLSP